MASDLKVPILGRPRVVRTAGKILADGTILELVSAQPRSARLSLLARRGKRVWSGRQLTLEGRSYRPADIPRSVLRNMFLPARASNYRSTRDLFDGLVKVFEQRLRLPTREARVSTYFAIASHFTDVLRVAPCLIVATADLGSAVQLLEVLGALCRHALTLANLQAGLGALPRSLCPTLLFSQASFSAAGVRTLVASQRRGFGILQPVGVTDAFCAKAMVIDEETSEQLLAMPSAEIYLAPGQEAPMVDDKFLVETAARFQPRLLDYRLKNYFAVGKSMFDAPSLAGDTREMARVFGACLTDDPELQSGVIEALRPQDEAARATRWTQLDSLVVEALLVLAHEKDTTSIYTGDVTELVNGLLESRKETVRFKDRKVGPLLRSLGLVTDRDSKGFGLPLFNDVRKRIHELARLLDVPGLRANTRPCEYCVAVLGQAQA